MYFLFRSVLHVAPPRPALILALSHDDSQSASVAMNHSMTMVSLVLNRVSFSDGVYNSDVESRYVVTGSFSVVIVTLAYRAQQTTCRLHPVPHQAAQVANTHQSTEVSEHPIV